VPTAKDDLQQENPSGEETQSDTVCMLKSLRFTPWEVGKIVMEKPKRGDP
jgi:hypothetical protein